MKKRCRTVPFVVCILAVAAGCRTAPPAAPRPSPAEEVARLSEQYFDEALRDSPEFGTYLGTGEYDDRLSDLSEPARLARQERLRRMMNGCNQSIFSCCRCAKG